MNVEARKANDKAPEGTENTATTPAADGVRTADGTPSSDDKDRIQVNPVTASSDTFVVFRRRSLGTNNAIMESWLGSTGGGDEEAWSKCNKKLISSLFDLETKAKNLPVAIRRTVLPTSTR